MARSRSRSGARRWLAGAGLLAFGAVIGVMLGAILDGPRMLVRRWTEEVRVLELPRPQVDAPALEEYAKLQTRQPKPEKPAAPPEPEPAKPRVEAREPSAPGDDSRGSGRDVSAPAPGAVSPEQLIAEIQQRRERAAQPAAKPAAAAPPAPKPAPEPKPEPVAEPVPTGTGRSGSTVQVAAYRDVGAAETLVRRLRRAGYDAYLSDRRASGPNKYRVRVQPRGGSVKTLAAQLEERGYGVWITRE